MARISDWEDDDDEPQGDVVKVQIENRYFDKLRARLNPAQQKAVLEGEFTAEPEKTKGPGYVIYGDDGRPIS